MTTATTSSVYIHVVEDVVNKVREEFVGDNGPGESVLSQLQATWELKLMQAGVILGPIDRSSAQKSAPGGPTPVHDLNVPYEGPEEYETPTAEMLFPPTPLQTPIQTPLPGTADNSMFNIPTGQSDYSENNELKSGRPSPYMQAPSPWMNQRPSLDVNVAYVEGREDPDRGTSQHATQDFFTGSSGKRKREDLAPQFRPGGYIPQQDGAGDDMPGTFELEIILDQSSSRTSAAKAANGEEKLAHLKGSLSRIPQLDGPIPDPYDDVLSTPNGEEKLAHLKGSLSRIPQLDGPIPDPYDDVLSTPNIYNYNEDYNNAVNTPAPHDLQAATPAPPPPQNDVADDDDDEDPLNENDDDEEDLDDVDQGEELNTQHLILAQFDKVTRTKSRWKCTLKDGIMHINSKDILFNKAMGEFDF